ncbi:hypothetical protein P7K49_005167 [Saguinus oedipus]|uniref:Uncharacterized protein n=1 Tax=Saguinus oedipus TaxID=9490 RepID=A0ABQ9W9H2_SAGOE|nr:hypothetical protein P7K49_005167 [Saguinus oedipus]
MGGFCPEAGHVGSTTTTAGNAQPPLRMWGIMVRVLASAMALKLNFLQILLCLERAFSLLSLAARLVTPWELGKDLAPGCSHVEAGPAEEDFLQCRGGSFLKENRVVLRWADGVEQSTHTTLGMAKEHGDFVASWSFHIHEEEIGSSPGYHVFSSKEA